MSTLFDKHDTAEHEADLAAKKAAAPVTEQEKKLARVMRGLGGHIFAYRLEIGLEVEFRMQDLARWLDDAGFEFEMDSPRRILSELKTLGQLDYQLVKGKTGVRVLTK